VLAGFAVGTVFAWVYYALGWWLVWPHFPAIARWRISQWLLIRDSSGVRDVLLHDYTNALEKSKMHEKRA
jgi:hypothetical protein